jgi:hypothetical protein
MCCTTTTDNLRFLQHQQLCSLTVKYKEHFEHFLKKEKGDGLLNYVLTPFWVNKSLKVN